MNVIEIVTGVALIAVAGLAFRLAIPGSDGRVRPWLKGDTREWPYAVFVLTMATVGASRIITGMVP